jgi:membrane protein DedA with SNARE-associated domain
LIASDLWPFVPLWLAAMVDRAGVPVTLLAGLALAKTTGLDAWSWVLACIVAGTLGDLVCFALGVQLSRRPVGLITQAALTGKLSALGDAFGGHLLAWVAAGRVFPAVNQLFPVLAGMRGLRAAPVAMAALAGNAVWLSAVGYVGWSGLALLDAAAVPLQTTTFVVGCLILLAYGFRRRETSDVEPSTANPFDGD